MKRILFVCSGNTCRSPLAEGIAKKILSDSLTEPLDISSAGTTAMEGVPASGHSIRVAREYGIDLTDHRARLLSGTLIREADLIITMSPKHKDTIGIIEPEGLDYTYLLTEFCDDEEGEVPDPIGSDIEVYQQVYQLIRKCLERFRDQLDAFKGWSTSV